MNKTYRRPPSEATKQKWAEEREQKRQERLQVWQDFKERVRERGMEILPAIVQKYGHVTLKPDGPGISKGCCPFHVEKTPSFQVSKMGYHCFGAACDASGDVFKFLQDKCGMTFKDALMTVADEVGISPPESGDKRPSNYKPRPTPEKAPVDPAAEYLMTPSRLGPHNLRTVPEKFFVPSPHRFMSLFREAKLDDDDNVIEEARVKKYKPEMVHLYKNVEGDLKLVILRCRFSNGKKIFLPLQVSEPVPGTPSHLIKDGMSWIMRNTGNDSRRPVYGAHDVKAWIADPNRGPILFVEGEKCADYANRVFPEPGTLVLSASGGFNANMLADWKEITDLMAESGVFPKRMVVWPDAEPVRVFQDETRESVDPQELYAKQIFSGFLRDLWASTQNSSVSEDIEFTRVIPPEGVEKGWDLADAVDEGWTRAKLEAYISAAVPVDLSHMDGHAPKAAENDAEASSELPSLGD